MARSDIPAWAVMVALVGLFGLATPAWPCGMPGDASPPPSPSSGDSSPPASSGGGASSVVNGAIEGARRGAEGALDSDLNSGDDGGSRRPGGDQPGQAASGAIGALGAAQAAANASRCAELRAKLASLSAAPDWDAGATNLRGFYDNVTQMTPAQLDALIAQRRQALKLRNDALWQAAKETGERPRLEQDPTLDWLISLRSAQIAGLDVDRVQNKVLRQIDAGKAAAAQIRAQLASVQNEMAELGCDMSVTTADSAPPDYPGPAIQFSPEPAPQ